MSLLKNLANLFDENSDNSLDKVLDKVERALGTTVDKVEDSVKKLDNVSNKIVKVSETAVASVDKLSDVVDEKDISKD
jgi:flagellar hook-associated protein FlgK